jgi:hypothetical protein
MSDLKSTERLLLEKFLGMESGYVLNFSNKTFQAFVLETSGIDIYDAKYDYSSGSKANRLRAFWKTEPNYVVGKLISDLLSYQIKSKIAFMLETTEAEQRLYDECCRIAERLKQESMVEHVEAIKPNIDEKNFSVLAKSIRECIKNNEPETALDRLHTFLVKYLRQLCEKYNIPYAKDEPLHSLFGKYVKHLTNNKLLESKMTERILKYSIHVLEAFNEVRNTQSFAHDNPILNYDESILIFANVSSTIKFIESVEKRMQTMSKRTTI